jgi:DNA gyrase/topoisomerase IV subunit A
MSGDNGMDIEIECEKNTVQVVLQKLYKYSDLQVSLSVNQFGIIDSIPELINLEKYIKVYVNHNIKCIQREYQFDLIKATDRKEIIDGLLKAIANIDDIIKIIKISKNSVEASQNLIKKYQFSENQAKAIIDMKLGKLANLESIELQKEDIELTKEIEKCNKILSSDKLQQKEFLKRLGDFTLKYG